jgi:hypothetical protein
VVFPLLDTNQQQYSPDGSPKFVELFASPHGIGAATLPDLSTCMIDSGSEALRAFMEASKSEADEITLSVLHELRASILV